MTQEKCRRKKTTRLEGTWLMAHNRGAFERLTIGRRHGEPRHTWYIIFLAASPGGRGIIERGNNAHRRCVYYVVSSIIPNKTRLRIDSNGITLYGVNLVLIHLYSPDFILSTALFVLSKMQVYHRVCATEN